MPVYGVMSGARKVTRYGGTDCYELDAVPRSVTGESLECILARVSIHLCRSGTSSGAWICDWLEHGDGLHAQPINLHNIV